MAVTVQKNLGFLFLAVWLIFNGLAPIIGYNFPGTFMNVLMLLSGVLILVNR
jgi:hypothetical protein